MRSYIFTEHELDAMKEYLRTGKRTPTFNKLIHHADKHRARLLTDLELLLILISIRHRPRPERPKLMPGRPPKLIKGVKP